jgi:hypothetical protein
MHMGPVTNMLLGFYVKRDLRTYK